MSKKVDSYDECFKSAFGFTIAEIQGANDVSIECLFNALKNNSGNPRKQSKALVACLGLSNWKWSKYDGSLAKESDYKKMAEAMSFRIEMMAHALHRREQLSEVAQYRPHWKFEAGVHEKTPEKCLRNDGVIKHYQDPFWQDNMPPCDSPYCQCQISSLSDRDIDRLNKKT